MEREQLNVYLQHCQKNALEQLCRRIESEARVERIKQPTAQTLLVPVTDPINGGSFYSGEVLVTSAITRVNGVNGWSMVQDDQPELADAVALLDAAFAAEVCTGAIIRLARDGEDRWRKQVEHDSARAEATRVQFDLL